MSARAAAARLVYESSLVDPAAPSNLSQSTRPVEAPKFGSDDGQGLREHMIKEWKYGRMTSEAVCTLSWHISRAGGSGVADLALNPKLTKQAEHLRKALEVKSKDSFYLARIPLWDKADEDRKYFDFPMYLPHEAFGKNFNRSPESFDPALNDESFLPRSYFTHELYLSKKGKACPIGYFSDAAPPYQSRLVFLVLLVEHLQRREVPDLLSPQTGPLPMRLSGVLHFIGCDEDNRLVLQPTRCWDLPRDPRRWAAIRSWIDGGVACR